LNQRLAQFLKLHELRLLRCHDIIKLIEQLVLVSQSRFQIDKALFAHAVPSDMVAIRIANVESCATGYTA
jgi:hypothetical protein